MTCGNPWYVAFGQLLPKVACGQVLVGGQWTADKLGKVACRHALEGGLWTSLGRWPEQTLVGGLWTVDKPWKDAPRTCLGRWPVDTFSWTVDNPRSEIRVVSR